MFSTFVPYFTGTFGRILEIGAIAGFAVGLGYAIYFFVQKAQGKV